MGFYVPSEPKYTVQQSVNLNVVGAAEVERATPTDVRTRRRLNRVCVCVFTCMSLYERVCLCVYVCVLVCVYVCMF